MKVARVVGTVVATIHHPTLTGRPLLVCDELSPTGEPTGGYVVAVDVVGAGVGQTVLLVDEGNSARQMLGDNRAPIRTVIAGIVDAVTSDG